MNDYISRQISKHCDDEWAICPMCGESTLEEKSNVYGDWVECTNCDYQGEQK